MAMQRRHAPTRMSRVGAFVSVLGAAVAVVVLAAPPSGATVRQVSVAPDMNAGIRTSYGTGCTYTVRAWLSEAVSPVTFFDNGVPFLTVPPLGGGLALARWVPGYEGDHTLSAVQAGGDGQAPGVRVFVGRGEHIGYACWVI